jgi:SAM-dependent methyltransferase
MKTVKFRDQILPYWVAEGFHSQYIFPIASKVCQGVGLDIGSGRYEWALPGSFAIDPAISEQYNATRLPKNPHKDGWDYIFSSHCLEHLSDWESVLKYWTMNIRPGGKLFLYLPHRDCLYWRPEMMPNGKHINSFTPKQMKKVLRDLGYINVFASQRDLAWSFAVFGEAV